MVSVVDTALVWPRTARETFGLAVKRFAVGLQVLRRFTSKNNSKIGQAMGSAGWRRGPRIRCGRLWREPDRRWECNITAAGSGPVTLSLGSMDVLSCRRFCSLTAIELFGS